MSLEESAEKPPTAADLYDRHVRFVWASLARLGVADADLRDQTQEVFLVAHRRIDSLDPAVKPTTWLFGICIHVAQRWRRTRRRRPETAMADPPEPERASRTPEDALAQRQNVARLERILDRLAPDKRVVFVMYELEGASSAEIADALGIPVGTVHSRLFHAREQFQKWLQVDLTQHKEAP